MRRTLTVVMAALLMMPGGAALAGERPWREVALPFLWPRFEVSEVAATAPDEAWIAGFEGLGCVSWQLPPLGTPTICSRNAIVRRWNGTNWENKNPPGLWNLRVTDLDASSRTNVWLTGDGLQGTASYLARWDGARWTQVAAPPGCSYLSQMHAVGADELWAVYSARGFGDSCVARWKAGVWQVHAVDGRTIEHIGSTGPGEIVIGTITTDGANTRATERYDGSAWEPQPIPASHTALILSGHGARYYATWNQQDLRKVTAAGVETIPPPPAGAGGYLLDDLGRLWAGPLHRYDGTAWQSVPSGIPLPSFWDWTPVPGSQGVLWAVGGTGPGDKPVRALTNG